LHSKNVPKLLQLSPPFCTCKQYIHATFGHLVMGEFRVTVSTDDW